MKTVRDVTMCLLMIAASLIAPLSAGAAPPAQDSQPISYGETVTAAIDESGDCLYFRFEGTAGDAVSIDMTHTSGDLDGTLALYQQNGSSPIAQNDDRPNGSLDPLIETTLPATDWYTIAACRLIASSMRPTSGTFTLTLNGPQTASGATPTPAAALSNSLFGDPNPTPTPAEAIADTITGTETVTLASGDVVSGTLNAETGAVAYALPVQAGDSVTLTWTATAGDLAPRLVITSETQRVLAEAATAEATSALMLTFIAPTSEVAALAVTRYGNSLDSTAGSFTLAVDIQPAAGNDVAPQTVTPDIAAPDTATPDALTNSGSDYLANTCQSGDQAISGLGNSDTLIDVYLASGDSYYPEELTRTEVFTSTDDLNAVFRVQNIAEVVVGAVFCGPDGTVYDAGSNTFAVGGQYLMGLDWEFYNELWPTGDWYVELYADNVLALTLGFSVTP